LLALVILKQKDLTPFTDILDSSLAMSKNR
ncbi:MAG: hypothetical protein ACI9FJ_003276, partial [Alteromonadaceae bacterium]